MGWHQAVSGNAKIPCRYGLVEEVKKGHVVLTAQENVLITPAPIHDVVPSFGVFDTQRPGHFQKHILDRVNESRVDLTPSCFEEMGL